MKIIDEMFEDMRARALESIEITHGKEFRDAAADLPPFIFEKLNAYEIVHMTGLILTARIVAQKETIEEVKARITKVFQ